MSAAPRRGAALIRLLDLDAERCADLLASTLPMTSERKAELLTQALADLRAWAADEGLTPDPSAFLLEVHRLAGDRHHAWSSPLALLAPGTLREEADVVLYGYRHYMARTDDPDTAHVTLTELPVETPAQVLSRLGRDLGQEVA